METEEQSSATAGSGRPEAGDLARTVLVNRHEYSKGAVAWAEAIDQGDDDAGDGAS